MGGREEVGVKKVRVGELSGKAEGVEKGVGEALNLELDSIEMDRFRESVISLKTYFKIFKFY